MALSARRSEEPDAEAVERDATEWYRDRLSKKAPVPERFKYQPTIIGPTWQRTDDGYWLLPERSLGWGVLGWCSTWLQLFRGEPWTFTDEQARFVLWWYSLDERGRFVFRDGVLQRMKGFGKDPLGATILAAELLGPVRFSHFDGDEPIGRTEPSAWCQTAAVSLEQTKNTMRLFPALWTDSAKERFELQVLKRVVYAMGGTRVMEAVTSSPATLEGARATFCLLNETHHWTDANEGHEMAAVIRRNAIKSPGGAARTLRITNAYDPSEDSVAQQDREQHEKVQAGQMVSAGLLYDSLEAPPEAPYTVEAAYEVVPAIRGDSVWLDVEAIVGDISDGRTPPSQGRRWWWNQIVAHEEAWCTPQQWDTLKDTSKEIADGEPVVLFFDGSKSDDATGLMGCRLSDGHLFTCGVWTRPPLAKEWSVPRDAVNGIVEDLHERLDVRGMLADPGTGEDETGERYWDTLIDKWSQEYGKFYNLHSAPAAESGRRHSVMWNMTEPRHQKDFTEACGRVLEEIESGAFTHDGNPVLRDHVRNCRRYPNKYGVSVGKEHRTSARKIDLAVCMIGARMARRKWESLPEKQRRSRKRSGKAEFF